MTWRIVSAEPARLPAINALIARSKAHWPWPEGYLERALPLLAITEAYLRENQGFEVLGPAGETLAFFAVEDAEDGVHLDHLWVDPPLIGQGVGRFAFQRLLRLAEDRGWREIDVLPDPPAEGFYSKLGFTDTGRRVRSRVEGGPEFSVFRLALRPWR